MVKHSFLIFVPELYQFYFEIKKRKKIQKKIGSRIKIIKTKTKKKILHQDPLERVREECGGGGGGALTLSIVVVESIDQIRV